MKSFNRDNVGSAFSAPLQKPFGAYYPPVTNYSILSSAPDNMRISWTPPQYVTNISGYEVMLTYGTSNLTVTRVAANYTFPTNAVNSGEIVNVQITVKYNDNNYSSTPFGFSFTAD